MNTILMLCQAVVGLGLLNVWLVRSGRPTPFRGGNSKTLKEEFAIYGLPGWMFWTVGILKVGVAIALLAGLFLPELVIPAAIVLAFLMLGAVVMHAKVKDPARKWAPAISVLALSLVLAFVGP